MSFSVANYSGNGDAMLDFERFYLSTKNILYSFLHHHTKDRFEVEDIAQETYLVALEQWEDLKNHPNPAGWLMITAKNLNSNYERHVYYRKETLPNNQEIAYEEEGYNVFVMEDLLENVYKGREKTMAKKYFLEGENIAELSDDLRISEGALRMRLYRMKNRLKTYVESK